MAADSSYSSDLELGYIFVSLDVVLPSAWIWPENTVKGRWVTLTLGLPLYLPP